MDLLWKDIRYALHSLRANPGFALVAILTLALGIGATTAILSVVNGVLLQPMPLQDPDRLVMVWEKRLDEPGRDRNVLSPRNFNEWVKEVPRTFTSLAAYFDWEVNLTGQADPELLLAAWTNGSFFRTAGVKPLHGRTYAGEDAAVAAEQNVVISHALWMRKFGGDPKVINRKIQIDGDTFSVIGVMPRNFIMPESRAELWIPFDVPEEGGRYLKAIGRLAPGVTMTQAQARMEVVGARTRTMHPRNKNWGVNLVSAHEQLVGSVRRSLFVVLTAVGLLLLIGCVNIANLLLSRATSRAKEMAVRSALGASRGQLVRQLLTESLILATIAGVVGVVLAGWATMLLVRFTPESVMLPRMNEITVDGRVLAATAVITLITGVLFGLAPALEASRIDLNSTLKSGSRGSTHDRRGKFFRNMLVVGEVALATLLLIGAGLLIKSFSVLEQVNPGVKTDGVLTARVVLTSEFNEGEKRREMLARILEQVRTVPGVESSGAIVSLNMPFTNSLSRTGFLIEGEPTPEESNRPSADIRPIAGDYFKTMGMRFLAGRPLNERIVDPKHLEIVVNEAFAQRYFPGRNPIGRKLLLEWFADLNPTIVGVVNNIHAMGLDKEAATALYLPAAIDPNFQFTILMKSSTDPASLQVPVTKVLRSVDPLMPVKNVLPLEDLISGTIARPRFNATMLTLFAVLGLLLASIGIYGVLSYSVTQRTHEMGIRMALGADPRDVLRLVVGDGMKVGLIGVLLGLLAALPATRMLESLLYGVKAADLTVFIGVALTLTLVALFASWVPAVRATRVQPMVALRPE